MPRIPFLKALILGILAMSLLSIALSQEQSTWDAIQERGTVRLGVASADPWYFNDPISGNWDGLGVRLGEELASDLGVELEVVETSWANAVAALQSDRIDIMFVLDATPERAESIEFLDEHLFTYALAVLHTDKVDAGTWDALNDPDLNIGVTLGTSIDRFVTKELPDANVSRYPSNDETVASFQSGRSDVVSMYAPALTMMQLRVGSGTISLPAPVEMVETNAGFRREDDSRWQDYLNETLPEYRDSGRIQELYEEYLDTRGINPSSVPALGD